MHDKNEMINAIINEMNSLFKMLVSGNYVGFCSIYADVMSRLAALYEGLQKEDKAHTERIEDLKAQIKRLSSEPEPGGSTQGGETRVYNYDPRVEEGCGE